MQISDPGLEVKPRVAKATIADNREVFLGMIAEASAKAAAAAAARASLTTKQNDVITAKQMNADNGLMTSTFTVCTRVRPAFDGELAEGGENFSCVLACAAKTDEKQDTTEACVVLQPTVSMRGDPKLVRANFAFDHTFGPDSTDDGIFERIGTPLIERVKAGQVACIFAYGQTGSGKTHTIGHLLDRVVSDIFVPVANEAPRPVTFSYLELLGNTKINDCLVTPKRAGAKQAGAEATADGKSEGVQIGELLDGRVEARNLSTHAASTADELAALVALAKARRSTAATERNAQSSRSHGIGILTIGQPGEATPGADGPKPGVLLVIDLAGSERAADSKGHSKERLEETKAVNLSLMALKDCIRARTLAATPSAGEAPFVPYRRSKLTLLMKDVFDVGCNRLCSTVVLCCISPLAKDAKHTINTLQYAAPLRVALREASSVALEVDPRDPAGWDHTKVAEWLSATATEFGISTLDTAAVLRGGISGLELCRLPEAEIHQRVRAQNLKPDHEASDLASKLHGALWTLICDAKTRRRKPNGKLVTDEEEAAEAAKAEAAQLAKSELWKEREKTMNAGSTLDAAAAMAGRMG